MGQYEAMPDDAPGWEAIDAALSPTVWPAVLLTRLGEIVFERGEPFGPGGRMDVPDGGGEVPPALAWIDDPQLGVPGGPVGAGPLPTILPVERGSMTIAGRWGGRYCNRHMSSRMFPAAV
jgi:hypothetical protein